MTEENNHICRQCGVEPGERHSPYVVPDTGEKIYDDLARCSFTGIQLVQCEDHSEECIPDIWDGEFPGVKECREYGMYTPEWSFWGESEDLNSLMVFSTWDSGKEKYTMREEDLKNYREKYDTIFKR